MGKSDLPSNEVQGTLDAQKNQEVQDAQKALDTQKTENKQGISLEKMQQKKTAWEAADGKDAASGAYQKENGDHAGRSWNRKKFFFGCILLTAIGFLLTIGGIAMGGRVTGMELSSRGFHVYAPALDEEVQGSVSQNELEPFDQVEIALDYADVRMAVSDSGRYELSYRMDKDMNFQYEVKDGKLTIKQDHSFALFSNHISWFSFGGNGGSLKASEAVVYVPKEAAFDEVHIKTESGNISCSGFNADDLKISAEYGDVDIQDMQTGKIETSLESGALLLERVKGKNCLVKSEYGNCTIKEVSLTEDMKLQLESGNVECKDVRMRDLSLSDSYGNVNGENVVCRNVDGDMESGDCEIKEAAFDNWNMKLEYGNIKLQTVKPLADYGYDLDTEYGSINIDGKNMGDSYSSLFEEKDNFIKINCESGDIRLE